MRAIPNVRFYLPAILSLDVPTESRPIKEGPLLGQFHSCVPALSAPQTSPALPCAPKPTGDSEGTFVLRSKVQKLTQ